MIDITALEAALMDLPLYEYFHFDADELVDIFVYFHTDAAPDGNTHQR